MVRNIHGLFSPWLVGGGIRGGYARRATDDFGFESVEQVVTLHDLHAKQLYALGLDHQRLTFDPKERTPGELTDSDRTRAQVVRKLLE